MYRDDLEAAQARGDALEREASEERERAEDLEREAAELRARNAELEAVASTVKPPVAAAPAPTASLLRNKIAGWLLIVGALPVILFGGRLDVGAVAKGIGLVAAIAMLVVGLSLVDKRR